MATLYATNQYTADGSNRRFGLTFPYLDPAHVHATVNGVEVAYSNLTGSALDLNAAPAAGAVVTVYRLTPMATANVSFVNGSTLLDSDLNGADTQLLYGVQEAYDNAVLASLNIQGEINARTAAVTAEAKARLDADTAEVNARVLADQSIVDQVTAALAASNRTWTAALAENTRSWSIALDSERIARDAAITAAIASIKVTGGTITFTPATSTSTLANSGIIMSVTTADINDKAVTSAKLADDANVKTNAGNIGILVTSPSGTSTNSNYVHSGVKITNDSVNQDSRSAPNGGTKVSGFLVDHSFGGASSRGGRQTIDSICAHLTPTASDNPDRNYLANQALTISVAGDGGTQASPQGAYFAMSGLTDIRGDSKGVLNACVYEFNTVTRAGADIYYHCGIQIASQAAVRGRVYDAAVSISQLPNSGVTWGNGILISGANGGAPLGTDSNAFKIDGATVPGVLGGFVATGVTFRDAVVKTDYTQLYNGSLSLTQANAAVTLGSGGSNTPYVDFKSSGTGAAQDARIIAVGGTSTAMNGNLLMQAGTVVLPTSRPASDGGANLGVPTFRWANIYAVNGTIQTSDRRQKESIETVDVAFADAMMDALDASSYVWKDNEEQTHSTSTTVTRQKTRTVTETVDETVISVVDGKAVRTVVSKEVTHEEPVFEEFPLVDEAGNPVMEHVSAKIVDGVTLHEGYARQVIHRVAVMEDVEEVSSTTSPAKANVRRHYGFIAQDVEAALEKTGKTSADFAGLIVDKDTGMYGLRMDQVLALMWPVVKGLRSELADVKAQLAALKTA